MIKDITIDDESYSVASIMQLLSFT